MGGAGEQGLAHDNFYIEFMMSRELWRPTPPPLSFDRPLDSAKVLATQHLSCVQTGSLVILVSVPVKVNRFALLFVDLLCYVGRDSRYSEEAPLSVLVVVEWILI